jgi:cellulose synthase/poly-beta-1,6-N-acetylglucosamine synthase-like glycosyltransferase
LLAKESLPKVSVIVPVKNGGAKIQGLLDSLMQIDYPKDKLEIMIVDGNSSDDTREIVSRYPVKLLLEEKHGINGARNTGVKHSGGDIIVFTDSDCVVPKDWIKRIVEDFQDSKIGCVGGNVEGYYDDFLSRYSDESIIPVMRRFKRREVLDTIKPPLHYPAGCNMAIKRDIIEKVGLFDENIMYGFDEDELVERICRKGNEMILDPEILVKHKHRSTLPELLKQNFRYGRGIGLLLKMRGIKSAFSKWILLCILGFTVGISVILSLALFTLFAFSAENLIRLLAILLVPPFGLILFYAYKVAKNRIRKYASILAYPLIDIARSLVFVFGGIYQLLKPREKVSAP